MKVVWALDTFPDSPVEVRVGEAWAADDPMVTGRPGAFTAVEELPDSVPVRRSTDPGLSFRQVLAGEEASVPEFEPPVEQATRGPGERRATRRLRSVKATGGPVKAPGTQVEADDAERDALTAEAKALGVEVDDRWPLATLRERVEAVRGTLRERLEAARGKQA